MWLLWLPFIRQHSSSGNWSSVNIARTALTFPTPCSPLSFSHGCWVWFPPLHHSWPRLPFCASFLPRQAATPSLCDLRCIPSALSVSEYLTIGSTILHLLFIHTFVVLSSFFLWFFFPCDIQTPAGGFRVFSQLDQFLNSKTPLSLKKCIGSINRVLIQNRCDILYFLLKRCAYLKAEPTLKDKEKRCIQAQGTVFCLSAR